MRIVKSNQTLLYIGIIVFCLSFAASELPVHLVDSLKNLQTRAVEWVMSQRRDDYGWGTSTARCVISLKSSRNGWPSRDDLEAALSAKELELEVLDKLTSDVPVSSTGIGYYVLGLKSICKDPHEFYGYNLIGYLKKHQENYEFPDKSDAFDFTFSSLVICLSGTHLHKRHVRGIVHILEDNTGLQSTGTKSLALLSLICIQNSRKSNSLNHHIKKGFELIGEYQSENGNFGNIHTTSLAIQSLVNDERNEMFWNITSGALALLNMQDPNGSFNDDLHGTTDALLAITALLKGKGNGLLKLRWNECYNNVNSPYEFFTPSASDITTSDINVHSSTKIVQNINKPATSKGPTTLDSTWSPPSLQATSINPYTSKNMSSMTTDLSLHESNTVKYFLWIGTDAVSAEKFNLTITFSPNSTFLEIMKKASEIDKRFEFSSTSWPNGHYVHTISGRKEDPIDNMYWLLYCMLTEPNPLSPPETSSYLASSGVDDLRVKDGYIYLYWFKKL